MIAETAERMPTVAITGRNGILIGRSRSGCERRNLIAAANMHTYINMYSEIDTSCSMAKASDVFGATTNTNDSTVTTAPCSSNSGIWTSFLLVFWSPLGRYPALPTSHMLRLGPAIQAIDAATAPSTSRPDRTLDRPGMPKPSAYTVKACEAPEVSSRVASGTATEIAMEPSMYITKTSAAADSTALKYDFGRPLRCLMWTALTSRPANSQANMKKISESAGTMVPRPTPRLLSPAVVFIPLETTNVASQNPTSTTVPMYRPLPARSGRPK